MINQTLLLAGDDAYNLTKSLRFRRSASAYLNRTPASSSSLTTWTWSGWVKRGALTPSGSNQQLFGILSGGGSLQHLVIWDDTNKLDFYQYNSGYVGRLYTTQVFRDPSAWYHFVFVWDTTNATAGDRIRIYVNGQQITSFAATTTVSQNTNGFINSSSYLHSIGQAGTTGSQFFDGYMAEVNFIDGQALTPSSFGETDILTGVWKPKKYAGTYGTNGFYLPFTDVATTSGSNAGLGKDFSGNGNYWNTNNISVTTGTTYDSMNDVPTLTSATQANYCVLNPLDQGGASSSSSGNLQFNSTSSDAFAGMRGTLGVTTGKWYFEATPTTFSVGAPDKIVRIGVADTQYNIKASNGDTAAFNSAVVWDSRDNGASAYLYVAGAGNSYGYTFAVNDVVMVAFDADSGKVWLGKNGSWNTGDPVAGTSPAYTMTTGYTFAPFTDGSNTTVTQFNFGQRSFSYTPPTGFKALNTYNLPTSTIVKGNTVMDATLYTGNSGTQSVVNTAGFKPDFVWLKSRSNALNHNLFDSVRGVQTVLATNSTGADNYAGTGELTAFNSNGFTLVNSGTYQTNQSTYTYDAWQWQAGQGSTSSNTNGSITSTVSVNASAGFSVVTYSGNSSAVQTVGHGLGVAPKFITIKQRTASGNSWITYTSMTGAGYWLALNLTQAATVNGTLFNNTAPTSSVFTVGIDSSVNNTGQDYVAYCWSQIAGFSSFGSYTGNGSTDGPFNYLGFRPKFVMIKATSTGGGGYDWFIHDTSRDTYNVCTLDLEANLSLSENQYGAEQDIVSNGFKLRNAGGGTNQNGVTYIYMAFAENPFKNALAR